MRDAVICSPLRLPVGRYGGMYRDIPVAALAATVVKGLVDRTGITSGDVDDVIFGQGYANGEAAGLGRLAALDAGLDIDVPGLQLDRRCGSGVQAVAYAAMQVQTGVSDLVLAGGAESMSQAEFYAPGLRWGVKGDAVNLVDRLSRPRVNSGGARFPIEGGMIETAENLRREYDISREEQDAFAVRSHERAVAAIDAGYFDAETVPMTIAATRREPAREITQDEHPRRDASVESLSRLRPIRLDKDPDATVTAGNASGQNDGAAVAIVTTPEEAERLGLRPMARLLGWGAVGVDPRRMGIGPVPAVEKVLGRLGLTLGDMDLIELNEAFAAQVLACTRQWNLDPEKDERFNVNGSGIALGHPIGATGGRIMAGLLNEMQRREVRYGLETMCIGGGQGIAAVFERWVD